MNALNQTAKRNVDFLMPASGITVKFEDGQSTAYVTITLIDDSLVENEEMFTLAITSSSSGARIGERKYLNVRTFIKFLLHTVFKQIYDVDHKLQDFL